MKGSILVFLFFVLFSYDKQAPCVSGKFANATGKYIEINEDSSYFYQSHFDLFYNWSVGRWHMTGDTIHFIPNIIYDTIRFNHLAGQERKDSMIVSPDTIADLIPFEVFQKTPISTSWQECFEKPLKLYFKKDRFYPIKPNGRISKRKIKWIWKYKRVHPYYRRLT
jgi:hypothetical protein